MRHRPMFALGFLISMLMVFPGSGNATSPADWPTRWRVHGNGVTGILELTIDEDGRLKGRLLGEPIEGFVSGRKLLVRRSADGRSEVWEGLLAEPHAGGEAEESSDPDRFVAGTFSVAEAGQTKIHPWYGIPETGAASTARSPAASTPLVALAPPPVEQAAPSPSPSSTGGLSGTWTSVTGERAEIVQEGKALTIVLADGSSHPGRMTGGSSLVVGLRQGCCNGKLEGPDLIVWSDGARWQRVN